SARSGSPNAGSSRGGSLGSIAGDEGSAGGAAGAPTQAATSTLAPITARAVMVELTPVTRLFVQERPQAPEPDLTHEAIRRPTIPHRAVRVADLLRGAARGPRPRGSGRAGDGAGTLPEPIPEPPKKGASFGGPPRLGRHDDHRVR